MRRLAILGSTGSIGQQTLEVVRAFPEKLRVTALAAGQNARLLARQVAEFKPRLVSCRAASGRDALASLEPALANVNFELLTLEEIAAHPEVDLVVVATSGKEGLLPTLAAIRSNKAIALANKEVLVMAGEIVAAEAQSRDIPILPIDSEHSALWQCLRGEGKGVARLILTASGGAFRHRPLSELASVTPEEALRHPTWRMGKKVTIDSATLMNKGMEVIEARWLFDTPFDRIEVVLHPESVVHSMVEFEDGSVKAQLSPPDMRLPIQYALSYPERWANAELPRLDWKTPLTLRFQPVDMARYPCLRLAMEAGRQGGTCPTVLSAADEVAVELFLSRRIGFLDIPKILEETLAQHRSSLHPSLEEILAADAWARETALSIGARC